jgi:hypothetical protein
MDQVEISHQHDRVLAISNISIQLLEERGGSGMLRRPIHTNEFTLKFGGHVIKLRTKEELSLAQSSNLE